MLELPPGPNGKRIRRKRRARTKTEALAILRQLRADFQEHGSVGDGRRLLKATMDDYLKLRESDQLAPKTLELDRWMAGIIVDGLGRRRVNALKVADCDSFLEAASLGLDRRKAPRAPVGRAHLRRIRSMLIRALRNDLRRGLVTFNVAELSVMPAPSTTKSEQRSLTYLQLDRLLLAADGVIAVLIDLSGRNGLRPAEARALRWSRLDLEEGLLRVDAQMSAANELVGPKTKRAARTIRIDHRSIQRLCRWHATQNDLREAAGPAWQELGLVVTTASGRPIERTNVRRSLLVLSDRCGIDPSFSPYELRHTAITLQADAGHAAWEIADWAGTSERMIADVYRHRLAAVSPLSSIKPRPN